MHALVDRLDQANEVLPGGALQPAAAGFEGAYVVRCGSLEEAREIAASDPLVRADGIRWEFADHLHRPPETPSEGRYSRPRHI
jgi:hypothetical protein